MYAEPGDWLIVKSSRDSLRSRRGQILAVGDDGKPPYQVLWLDIGRQRLVFPGPDARVVTAADQLKIDRAQLESSDRVQATIKADRH